VKKNLGLFAAVFAFCCFLTVGIVSRALAAECTTQGSLALALADVLGIEATSAQAAADALAAINVAPALGWDVEACLTEAVKVEISAAFAALNREAGGFERALGMIDTGNGSRATTRGTTPGTPPGTPPAAPPATPPVSPFRP
jgi:hypothetical protein